jgi:chromate transporter
VIFLQMFLVFFRIGLFTIGGGYAILPMIQKEVVQRNWLTNQEYADILAISEVTPGPFSVNAATFVGFRLAGFPGALVATLSLTLPSFLIILLLGRLLARWRDDPRVQRVFGGVRPAVTGTIAAAALILARSIMLPAGTQIPGLDWRAVLIAIGGTVLLLCKTHPILMLVLAGFAGWLLY